MAGLQVGFPVAILRRSDCASQSVKGLHLRQRVGQEEEPRGGYGFQPVPISRPNKGRVTWPGQQGYWCRPLGLLSHSESQGFPRAALGGTAGVAVGDGRRFSLLARDTRFPKVSLRLVVRHRLWVARLPSRCSFPTMQLRSLRPWRTPRDGPLPPPGRVSHSTSNPEGAGAAAVAPAQAPGGRRQVRGGAQPPCARVPPAPCSRIRSHCPSWMLGVRQPRSPRGPTASGRGERGKKARRPAACDPHCSAARSSARRARGQGGMMV